VRPFLLFGQASDSSAGSVTAGEARSSRVAKADLDLAAVLHFGSFERRQCMMGILGWVLFGLVVGIIAKLLMPGRDPGGFIITTLLGIVGAVIGGFLGRSLGLYGPGEPAGFLMATLGAVVLLFLYRMLRRPARV
jgi:uncharacterized membrane protein YeaQ/YmgE (transglycosylase-associated protein family)